MIYPVLLVVCDKESCGPGGQCVQQRDSCVCIDGFYSAKTDMGPNCQCKYCLSWSKDLK